MAAKYPSIHLLSDLHLELGAPIPKYLISMEEPIADIIVLAGDIGNPFTDIYLSLIALCSKKFTHVIVIAGNHEYYHLKYSIPQIDTQIQAVCLKYPNVHFLQRSFVVIDSIRFVGCTLWSNPTDSAYPINDFNRIKWMTLPTYRQMFQLDRKFLVDTLAVPFSKTVVITHHLPSYQLISPKYQHHPSNSFFATDLEDLMDSVDIWLCGHTHTSIIHEIQTCRCYINPIGYQHEVDSSDFHPELVIYP